MAMHIRSVFVLLAVVVVAVGCGGEPPEPTPDVAATVESTDIAPILCVIASPYSKDGHYAKL